MGLRLGIEGAEEAVCITELFVVSSRTFLLLSFRDALFFLHTHTISVAHFSTKTILQIFNHATFFIDRYVSYIVNLEKGFSCPLFDNLRIIRNVFSKSLKYFANLFLGKCTTLFSKKSTIEA